MVIFGSELLGGLILHKDIIGKFHTQEFEFVLAVEVFICIPGCYSLHLVPSNPQSPNKAPNLAGDYSYCKSQNSQERQDQVHDCPN